MPRRVLGFPDIIILDEPTVGLDPKQIIEIRELIRRLSKEHTVILSSHILAEIREVCDYILIISRGKLVASDTPENLEKMLGESDTVEIETESEPAVIEETLKNVPGIERIVIMERTDGITRAQIHEKKGEDVRARIFRAFAGSRLTLLTLRRLSVSLEDVFMELTQKETVPEVFIKEPDPETVEFGEEDEDDDSRL